MSLHRDCADVERHAPWRRVFANAAARTGDAQTYVQGEIDNLTLAIQVDTRVVYYLTALTPTWTVFAKLDSRDIAIGDVNGVVERGPAWLSRSRYIISQGRVESAGGGSGFGRLGFHITGGAGSAGAKLKIAGHPTLLTRYRASAGQIGFYSTQHDRTDSIAGLWLYATAFELASESLAARTIFAGIIDNLFYGAVAEGTFVAKPAIGFYYDASVDGNWHALCKSDANTDGTNTTTVDTGVAVSNTVPALFEVRINAAYTSVTFYLNQVLVATITTDLPSASLSDWNISMSGYNTGATRGGVGLADYGIAYVP